MAISTALRDQPPRCRIKENKCCNDAIPNAATRAEESVLLASGLHCLFFMHVSFVEEQARNIVIFPTLRHGVFLYFTTFTHLQLL
jgi:hypothetical protein